MRYKESYPRPEYKNVDWNYYSGFPLRREIVPFNTEFCPCQNWESEHGDGSRYVKCPFSSIYGVYEDKKLKIKAVLRFLAHVFI